MEWIGNMINGANGLAVLATVILAIVLLAVLAKLGILSINTKGVRLGADADTRNLIQAQMEYARSVFQEAVSKFPKNLDTWRTKYVISMAMDVMERAIIFNNMSTDESYVKSKQASIYSVVLINTEDDWFKSDEFKEYTYKIVADLIKDLVKMKHR